MVSASIVLLRDEGGKSMALVMALLLCFSMFVSFGTTAQAAGERSEIYMVSFPRDAETNRDHLSRQVLCGPAPMGLSQQSTALLSSRRPKPCAQLCA